MNPRSLTAAACLFLASSAPSRAACPCAARTLGAQLQDAETAFQGTVLDEKTTAGEKPITLAKFTVAQKFRGELPKTLWLETDSDASACGVSLERGGKYLIFLPANKSRADACDVVGPGELTAAQARELRPLPKPGIPGKAPSRGPRQVTADEHRMSMQRYLNGVLSYQKGDYLRARREWSAAVDLDPSNTDARSGLDKLDQLLGPEKKGS